MKIQIKPLSINEAWQGRRFKSKKYIDFEREFYYLLPNIEIPDWPIAIMLRFGFSRDSDIDNCVKPTLDVMQKRYWFNDIQIKSMVAIKEKVKKWQEYIRITICKAKELLIWWPKYFLEN